MSDTPRNEDNRGVLFKEAQKKSDKSPDWGGNGSALEALTGKTIEVAGWARQGRAGQMISLAFNPPRNQPPQDLGENSGLLTPVKAKRSDRSPDYEGAIHVSPSLAGLKLRISAWENKDGSLRLAIQELRSRA